MNLGKFLATLFAIGIANFAADTTNRPGKIGSIFDIFRPKTNTAANPATNSTLQTNFGSAVISKTNSPPVALTNTHLAGLPADQLTAGLKQALSNGLTHAVSSLGRTNGFLTNLNVRIPLPAQLARLDASLRKLGQGPLMDEFIATMNHAAEQAVPAATAVFMTSLSQMTIADAQTLLLTTNKTAATEYFRKTTTNQLTAQFLPIVQNATTNAGVTRAYKAALNKAGFLSKLLGAEMDIDGYVTAKSLDGLFTLVAEEEKRIRENPQARVTTLLQKVFGVFQKPKP